MSNSNNHSSNVNIIIVQGVWQSENFGGFSKSRLFLFFILLLQMQLPAGNKGSRDSMGLWRGDQQLCSAREREQGGESI